MMDIEHQSEAVRYAAQHTSCTVEEVDRLLSGAEEVLQEQLRDLYEGAWDSKRQTFVTRDQFGSVVFGLPPVEWKERLSDLDLTDDEVVAVLAYHQYLAREINGFVVETRTTAKQSFSPVFIQVPDEWREADRVATLRFKKYFIFGLTPAEALDYWLSEFSNWDKDEIAGWRNVNRAAVNKNLRQARKKIGNYEEATSFYENKGAHLVPIDEVDEEHQPEPPEKSGLSSVGDS
ncbi:hypothetical protein [Halobacterium salinarum]|uniref:hypothetical protein n=1 Tax=Halobacterium salinarum TaxID=2242 RepID=UPI001F1EB8B7|nr:hypothetical protein [Halobacterium salinarum]MCF2166221.1 hypothetical protein [Halobacterium salinarum]MCF2167704.1 hypothetical protein [Halobacterium salinarum]